MRTKSRDPAAETENEERADGGARPERPRWTRQLRRALLCLIGLLFVVSIPWYRGDAPPARIFGLPDWVAVAILCYAAAAVLNSVAWLLTDIPESIEADEARKP
jgi:hypothetical protein